MLDDVNFKVSSSLDPMDVTTLAPTSGNIPTNYRLTKTALAKSGVRKTETFTFGNAKTFDSDIFRDQKCY